MKYTIVTVWSAPTREDLNNQRHIVYSDLDLRGLIDWMEHVHEWHKRNVDHNNWRRATNNGESRIPEWECRSMMIIEGGDKPNICSYDPYTLTPSDTTIGCNTI